ncbi:MAG: zf-HC2 domain-containing protein [Armatimonadetes bacterium]|nr:zf-HC2 domain-containing protein [Armatimonadota bacterium]
MTDECRKFLHQLHDWFEGCVDEETKLLVQWHLRNCTHCQRLVAEWKTIADEICASLSIPASEGFDEKLRRRLIRHQLVSLRELTVSWALTSGGVTIAALWLGVSFTEIFRSIPQWVLSFVGWSILPFQWLQQFWEIVSRWA